MKTSVIFFLKKASFAFVGTALIVAALNVPAFSQVETEPEEMLHPASLTEAKTVLQKMGISLQSELGKATSLARTWVFSAKITDPEKAFNSGFQVTSKAGSARVANGTEIFLTVGYKGEVTLFVNSQNKLRSQANQLLSVSIVKSQLVFGVEVKSSSFPAFTR
jgi:hypothetical protein